MNEPDLVNAIARAARREHLLTIRMAVEDIKKNGTNEELFKLRDFLDAQARLVSELIFSIHHGFANETQKDR